LTQLNAPAAAPSQTDPMSAVLSASSTPPPGAAKPAPVAHDFRLPLRTAEFEAGMPPPQIVPETVATKLGRLAGRAIADFRKRTRENS